MFTRGVRWIMYESFFEFTARPFLASPIANRYYPAAAIEHAREAVTRCLDGGQGIAVILGPAGTGKSTLCQVLAEQMWERFQVATLASARLCTRRALLQNILFELKLPYRDREEGELRLSLIDHLEPSDRCPHGMLLLVDEAHTLPLRLLEEIRMLTNLVRNGEPRVRVVMAAGLALDERLASPRLESLNQRIAARCYLQSMSRDETCGYIQAQIGAVGGKLDRVFTPDALQAVYRATDGIPRLVNQLCDHVMILAAIGRRSPIAATGVEEAWADLQQLPTPWGTSPTDAVGGQDGALLEFGELDDDFPGTLGSQEDATGEDPVTPASPAHDVSERLEEIESGIAAISLDDDLREPESVEQEQDAQFRPVRDRQPEIELVFHHAHDPFNERFAEEEVIVDPLASLQALDRSSSQKSQPDSSGSTIPFRPAQEPPSDDQATAPEQFCAAEFESIQNAQDLVQDEESDYSQPLPGDDRDLLEIQQEWDESDAVRAFAVSQQAPRRREYRQLFAKLRRK